MRVTTEAGLCLAFLGISLLLGPSAEADTCPAGQHWNEWGDGTGFCSADTSGGGNGGNVSIDLGGGGGGSYGEAGPAPVGNTPAPPIYVPAPAAPVVSAVPQAPAPVQAPVPVAAAPQIATGLGQVPTVAGQADSEAQDLPQASSPAGPGGLSAPAADSEVAQAAGAPGAPDGMPAEMATVEESAAAAAPVAPADAPEARPQETINGSQVSDTETAAGGFIAAVLAVLVAAAGVLYWRKGRSPASDTPSQ